MVKRTEWPRHKIDDGNRGHHPTTVAPRSGIELRWTLEEVSTTCVQPLLVDEHLYISDNDGVFRCIDPDDGSEHWHAFVSGSVTCGPGVVDDLVYVGRHSFSNWTIGDQPRYKTPVPKDSIRVYDTETGAQVNSAAFDCVFTQVLAIDDSLVFGTGDPNIFGGGAIHRIELDTLETIWTTDFEETIHSVASSDDSVFVADAGGAVTALDVSDGALQWTTTCSAPDDDQSPRQIEEITVDEDVVVVTQAGGRIFALDSETGSIRWMFFIYKNHSVGIELLVLDPEEGANRRYVRKKSHGPPAIADGTAYFSGGPADVGCAAVDLRTTEVQWLCECPGTTTSPSPTVADGLVVLGSREPAGAITAIDAETGRIVWTYPLDDLAEDDDEWIYASTPPAVVDERIYVPVSGVGLCAFEAL